MSTGPKAPKRPRDPNQLAKSIVAIATGDAEDKRLGPIDNGAERGECRLDVSLGPLQNALPQRRAGHANLDARSHGVMA